MAEQFTLRDCPPGLFLFDGALGLKTEYRAMEPDGPTNIPGSQIRWKVGSRVEAYVAESGEVFWGGTSTHDDREALMVTPVDADALTIEPHPFTEEAPVSGVDPQPHLAALRAGTLSKNGASVTLDFDCGVDADAAYEVLVGLLSPQPQGGGDWRATVQEACDLLAERIHGNPARSAGHNARLVLERLLSAAPKAETSLQKVQESPAELSDAIAFMQQAGAMLGRGEMPAPASPYAGKWHRAHAVVLAALSTPSPVSVEEIAASLKRLTLMARTSGGTAGPDAALMEACGEADAILARLSPAQEGAE